ncbi:MAG: RNA polymerase sigma factor [Deltaproteobacteria bacterium]|nr:RNA polymerase sigma factor [Deltaproteobacteria bacterium]
MGHALALPWTFAAPEDQTLSHEADVALLRAALRADARAQLELVRRLTPTLRAVATAILGRGGDADDGVQVSLMRVLERASTYRGDASLERWARTVAVRACLRLAESARRHDRTDDAIEDHAEPEDGDDALIETLPGPLENYLEQLPAAQRQALLLRHALGYSVVEIAELTSVPVDTIKSRLLFGLRALRKSIRRDSFVARAIGGHRG